MPVAGSAYTYAYATLGEFVAWVIGWDLILEYALGAATVAVGWSGNLVTLLHQLGLSFPAALSAAPGTVVPVRRRRPGDGGLQPPGGAHHDCGDGAAHRRRQRVGDGERGHRRDQGRRRADRDRRRGRCSSIGRTGTRSSRANTGTFGEYGWSGILRGAGVIFFAYIGFDAVSTSAQEARNPQRDMPRGILGSLAICTVLYVLVSGVMVGLVPYKAMLNQPAPLVIAIEAAADRAAGTPWQSMMAVVRVLVTVGALAGLSSVMVVMMLAQPRIFLAMAQRRPAAGLGVAHPSRASTRRTSRRSSPAWWWRSPRA